MQSPNSLNRVIHKYTIYIFNWTCHVSYTINSVMLWSLHGNGVPILQIDGEQCISSYCYMFLPLLTCHNIPYNSIYELANST